MKFTVKADTQGPVALKQIRFNVNITDGGTPSSPAINTMSFFRGSTNITNSVGIIDKAGNSIEATATTLTELNSSDVYVVFDTEEVVPAGTTYTYTLKGTPSGFMGISGDTDSVVTSIAQDTTPSGVAAGADATEYYLASAGQAETAIQYLNAAVNQTTGTLANIIWSDNSAQIHGYVVDTAANGASADWFNGYLIKSLPLSGNGINYNN